MIPMICVSNLRVTWIARTALHKAVFAGKSEIVKFLLEKGADADRRDSDVRIENFIEGIISIELRKYMRCEICA
jgi:hypothetical protein